MSGRVSDEERSEVSKTPIQQLSDAEDDDAKSEVAVSEAGSGEEDAGSGDEDAGSGDEEAGSGDEEAGSGDEEAGSGDEEAGSGDEDVDAGSERVASPATSDVLAADVKSVTSATAADQKSIVSVMSDAVARAEDKLELEEYDGELQEAADQVREAISDEADAVVAAKDDAIVHATDLLDKEADEAVAELAETIEVPEVIPPTGADITPHLPTLAEEDVPAIPNLIPESDEEKKIVEDIKTKIEQPQRKLSAVSLPGAGDAAAAVEKSGWKKVFFCCN